MSSSKFSFDDCAFKPQRESLSDFLTEFLVEEKEGFVLNLNGSWGVGKTHFLKSWEDKIKSDYPVVYIDAWKTDFADDPLLVVVNSIIEFLKKGSGSFYDKELAVISTVYNLTKPVIRVLGSAAGGLIGAQDGPAGAIAGASFGREFIDQSLARIEKNKSSKDAKKHFDNYRNKLDALDQFKIAINEWADCYMTLTTNNQKYPIFIFVDELDRCRPNYAIELLETVKHMFDLPNFVFVIATDTEQLKHSIKAVYGEKFDSSQYLTRFFDSTFQLPAPNIHQYLQFKRDNLNLTEAGYVRVYPTIRDDADDLYAMLGAISEAYGLELRDIDKLLAKLNACLRYTNKCGRSINIVCLIHGIIQHQKNIKDFNELPNTIDVMTKRVNFQLKQVDALWLHDTGEDKVSVQQVVQASFSILDKLDEYFETYDENIKISLFRSNNIHTWKEDWMQESFKIGKDKVANWSFIERLVLMSGGFDE
jgi:hypothetical protein